MTKIDARNIDLLEDVPMKERRREIKIRNHLMDDRGNKSYTEKSKQSVRVARDKYWEG